MYSWLELQPPWIACQATMMSRADVNAAAEAFVSVTLLVQLA